MEGKVMGIIRRPGYGCSDMGVCLHFEVYLDEGLASGQMMFGKKANKFIAKYNVDNVVDLNGKPVWVRHENHTMTDLEPCIIFNGRK